MQNNNFIDLRTTNIKIFIDGKEVLVQSAKVLNIQETTMNNYNDPSKRMDIVNKSELVITGTINKDL